MSRMCHPCALALAAAALAFSAFSTCESFSGFCSASMPYSSVSAQVALGSASGSLAVNSIGRDGAGSATIDGTWWDTITITSDTLPYGTPVTVSAHVLLQAAVVVSAFAPSPYTRAQAGLTYGGPDGTGLAFASTQSGFVLDSAGSVDASAFYGLDVLTPGATYTTASGHSYVSSVPEAPAWTAWAGGLVLVGWRPRQRHAG